jgi:hypothetical protein
MTRTKTATDNGTAPAVRGGAAFRARAGAAALCAVLLAFGGIAPALRGGAWFAGSARAQGEPLRVDGLAAVVGGAAPSAAVDTVLLSDVELRARIVWSGQHADADVLGPMPNAVLQGGLDELVNELLIAREAVRVKAEIPGSAEIARERARLIESAGGQARLSALMQALGVREDELDAIARRRAAVGAFLSANLQGVTVVTDSEVERAYAERAQDFAGRDREVARNELRARMSRDALDRAVGRWVSVLRSRTQVRLYVQY